MALIEFLQRQPTWLLAILLNVWLMGFALAGLWLFRRHVLPRLGVTDNVSHFVSPVMQSCLLLYSLIAALTAVSVWTRYAEVSSVVSGEATAITSLWRDLGGYPEPLSSSLRDLLRGYTDQVINGAWPQMQRGQIPEEGVAWMDRIQAQLYAFEPATDGQRVIHAETIKAFNSLVEQRRQRLDAAGASLPSVFWIVLLGGPMVCIMFGQLYHNENAKLHALLLLGLSASLAMVLLVILSLDTPYTGDMGITAESYQLVYDHHMR